ncbi:MAG: hypothetical protein KF774_17510 [Planctomyces sp.]|nr:hypothetical protein [Planctomyces sp.]
MLDYRTASLGGLNCIVAESSGAGAPEAAAILMHGFGAPGDDLVGLAEELVTIEPSLRRMRFVFPAAPLEPPEFAEFGGRAWWPLDVFALQRAVQMGEFRDLRRQLPGHLPVVREQLVAAIDALCGEAGWDPSRIVLGGFSQGSMLATDVALRMPKAPGGLVVWSGTLLCEDEWRSLAPNRKGLRVHQSHGRQDPILPFEAAVWLRDLLTDAGLEVSFTEFQGPHTIPREGLRESAKLMASLLD